MPTPTPELARVRARVDEHIMGDVMAQLTKCGAWVDGIDCTDGVASINIRLPKTEVTSFESWLSTFTAGTGRFEALDE